MYNSGFVSFGKTEFYLTKDNRFMFENDFNGPIDEVLNLIENFESLAIEKENLIY